MTGQDLLDDLDVPEENEECWAARSHAYGYLQGVIDAHQTIVEVEGISNVFRFPQGYGAGELMELLRTRLVDEPDFLDANGASLILRIMATAFPVAEGDPPLE